MLVVLQHAIRGTQHCQGVQLLRLHRGGLASRLARLHPHYTDILLCVDATSVAAAVLAAAASPALDRCSGFCELASTSPDCCSKGSSSGLLMPARHASHARHAATAAVNACTVLAVSSWSLAVAGFLITYINPFLKAVGKSTTADAVELPQPLTAAVAKSKQDPAASAPSKRTNTLLHCWPS